MGIQRLKSQDVEYSINQLVEVAVRALSPGINDPFTAINCVDQLSATLAQLAERSIPSGYRYDDAQNLRLITDAVTFEGMIETAFDQVRQYGVTSVALTTRLLEAIAIVGEHAQTEAQRKVLIRQARMIRDGSERTIPEANDREAVNMRYRQAAQILGHSST